MPFNSIEQAQTKLGNIQMFYVGIVSQGFHNTSNKKFRKYILQSQDLSKLLNITNAIDGSEAYVTDTNTKYILGNGQWYPQ